MSPLFAQIRSDIARCARAGTTRLYALFSGLLLIVPLIGGLYVFLHIPQIEQDAYSNLSAIAKLNAEHVEDWMHEREADLEVIMTRPDLLELAAQ